jgi:hypothetical protein
MKTEKLIFVLIALLSACTPKSKESVATATEDTAQEVKTKHLYLDVHNLEPGKVTFDAVAGAHQKDLATQGKYDVSFLKYWVDESAGKVYCLVESPDSASVFRTHKEAHGLTPDLVQQVSDGLEAAAKGGRNLYLDIHRLGAGNVTTKAVADAHTKDLAVQGKYDVNFIDYWVDIKSGTVVCLSEADNEKSIVSTHKEAHGLLPAEVHQVKQGQ